MDLRFICQYDVVFLFYVAKILCSVIFDLIRRVFDLTRAI
jgi:hypothetical protein